jgi:hypothetical protein
MTPDTRSSRTSTELDGDPPSPRPPRPLPGLGMGCGDCGVAGLRRVSEPVRLDRADLRLRLELAEWLAKIARHVAGDEYADGPMTRAAVVLWGPDGPTATWHGRLTAPELERDISRAIREQTQPEGQRPSDFAIQRDEHDAKEAAAAPFLCSRLGGCGRRFKTERGRQGHEAFAERARAQYAAVEAEYPLHDERGCWLSKGSSHCRCGLWPPDKRRPHDDYSHRERPAQRPAALQVLSTSP